MNQDFRRYIEEKLPREDDKELFRDLLEFYSKGGPDEVKAAIFRLINEISGA